MITEKEKILEAACEVFFSRGFYKIPVDEIAVSLKMSKKTIYKHFPTKEDLVREVARLFLYTHSTNILGILKNDYNAVEKLFYIFSYLGNALLKIHEQWFSDVQNHFPEIWVEIEEFRSKYMNMNLSKIIKQGKEEGYIVNLPSIIIINIYLTSIRGIVNPQFILHNKIPAALALESTLSVLMNGILTPKGKTILKKLKTENV